MLFSLTILFRNFKIICDFPYCFSRELAKENFKKAILSRLGFIQVCEYSGLYFLAVSLEKAKMVKESHFINQGSERAFHFQDNSFYKQGEVNPLIILGHFIQVKIKWPFFSIYLKYRKPLLQGWNFNFFCLALHFNVV